MENIKETSTIATIARLDERTRLIVENLDRYTRDNEGDHKTILESLKILTEHVNHSNEGRDKRILELEFSGGKSVRDELNKLTAAIERISKEVSLIELNGSTAMKIAVDKLSDCYIIIDKRVLSLEKERERIDAEKKGALFVYKVAIAILAGTLTLMSILKIFGLF